LITVAIATFPSDALTQLSYAQTNKSSFQSLDNTTQTTNASNTESQRDDVLCRSSTWLNKWTDSATDPDGQIRTEGKQIPSEEEELHEQKTKICKRILLVDDEPDSCMVYQIVLEDAGYECKSYTDSVKALQQFRHGYYDLILLDIKMPVLNGFELCKKIREVDKTVKVIFITAGEDYYEQLRIQSYPDLINDTNIKYVHKPIANDELLGLVTRLY
jgi:CheY-like chemotaxis protein